MPFYKSPHPNKTRLQLAQERADRLGALVWLVLFALAFAITSQWDYEAAREAECWEAGLQYDPAADRCIPQPPATTKEHSHAQTQAR